MLIELILDSLNEDDLNMKMRLQEESTLLLGVFHEMKKDNKTGNNMGNYN